MKKILVAIFVLSTLIAAPSLGQPIPAGRGISYVATIPGTTAGAGTVATDGTTAIVGIGTSFLTTARVNRWLTIDGEPARLKVVAVADNTHLTLGEAATTTASGLTWSWSDCSSGPAVSKSTAAEIAFYQCSDGLYVVGSGGGGGSGDVVGPASSVNTEVALFSGTTGKLLKRATGSGIAKLASGVLSAGAASTDLTDSSALVTTTTITNFSINASLKTLTVQPVTDLVTATFRRSSAAQTSHFLDLQDEANNVLAYFDATGAFIGNVTGALTGNATTASDGVSSASGTLPLTLSLAAKAITGSVAITPTNNGGAVALQATTPGTAQTGNANLSGTVVAGAFSGPLTGDVTGTATPTAHASTHASAGSDPVTLAQSQVTDLATDLTGKANTALSNLASVAINDDLVTGPGVSAALRAAAPTAAASTTAGALARLTASNATAGTTNAGANVGGPVFIAAGNAARLTSGDADGGSITLTTGAGIGTGAVGHVVVKRPVADATAHLFELQNESSAVLSFFDADGKFNGGVIGTATKADALNSATTVVNVSSATAPSNGQVLTATSSTAATWQTPSSGGAACSTCTANVIQKGNGADTLQDSGLTEASAGALTTAAGVTFSAQPGAPTQQASAVAGTPITLRASDATAGSVNIGGATGGKVSITAGDGKVLTSGTGNGGDVELNPGAGAASGVSGFVRVKVGSVLRFDDAASTFGLHYPTGSARLTVRANGDDLVAFNLYGTRLCQTCRIQSGSDGTGLDTNSRDVGIRRDAAAVWQIFGVDPDTTAGGIKQMRDANGSWESSYTPPNTELLTLGTGGTTTATATNIVPASSDVRAIAVRVTTTITTATSFTVAPTGKNPFCIKGTTTSTLTTLTTGTVYELGPCPATYGADLQVDAATTVTVTTDVNPGAGAVRLTTMATQFSGPTS